MNDLNLRVSGRIGEKVKKPVAPIAMPNWNTERPGSTNEFINGFLNSTSADEQLKFLKQYLNNNKNVFDEEIVEFLVSLFWGADAKHPMKGFLKKHITESKTLREPFTKHLIEVITDEIKQSADLPYGHYTDVVTHLDTCIDKFPPGAEAVCDLEIPVSTYLLHCLELCVRTLSEEDGNGNGESKAESLSPSEINKIYDLVHLSLRLLLYLIQKITDSNRSELNSMFERIRAVTAELMRGKEVPMDTKSVSGIVTLNLHLFENGPDSWIQLLEQEPTSHDTVNLCLYSAVATAVPRPALRAAGGARPALLALADKVLAVGDRYSSEPSHALAVARTMLAISKALPPAAPLPAQLPAPLAAPLAARLAAYCWPQLDHHMDSVRHLATQTIANVLAACVHMENEGDPSALQSLLSGMQRLGSSRGAWAARAQLAGALGRRALALQPRLLAAAAAALRQQPLQASATVFLETLLQRYTREAGPEAVCREYVRPVLDAARAEAEPSALAVLERLLAKAVQWDNRILDYILPDKSELFKYEGSDLKCILLVLGVVRKSGVANQFVTLDQLEHTMYDADDETRLLALALVASAPRSTAPLPAAELAFALRWLRYNLNAQAPAFRQLMLAHMRKILKRLEDSLNIFGKSQRSISTVELNAGIDFSSALRQLCFDSLVAGAGPARRACALQLLACSRRAAPLLARRPWTEERAELLYNVLEDPYETNKALALEILKDCPAEFISKIEGPGAECLSQLVRRAGGGRPPDCAAAAYKLLLLAGRALPLAADTQGYPEREWFCLLRRLLAELRAQAARAHDLRVAARNAPMFGLVHCIDRAAGCIDPEAIAGHSGWSQLVADVITACSLVAARAEPVVSAQCPEGLLPAPDGDACPDDEPPVTAQMVLLFAWRSVKETSLLLGTLVSRLCLEGESEAWTLSAAQVESIGAALRGLLVRLRHRGAFEQAYVGFSALLARLWRSGCARLRGLPPRWFADVERDLLLAAPPEGATEYCATRRGAGLPFMIQALVMTELAASAAPRGRLLARALALCLAAARAPASAEAAARAHLVLRALVRHAEPGAPATAAAVMVAVRGFDAGTWMERNSSTLLFAALMVRIFGVQRGKDPQRLCARNRMTGRIFFLRYPELYDFMLEQLQGARPARLPAQLLLARPARLPALLLLARPARLPALLLLARLYPSALEGTVSNLKLERFLPLVTQLAGASDIATRRLAARAAQPLVAPHAYIPHIQSLFKMLSDPKIKTNLCHGILCQLSVLLGATDVALDDGAWLPAALAAARWLVAAASCVVAHEYLCVLRLALARFPEPGLLDEELLAVSSHLEQALFARTRPPGAGARELFLARAAHMLLILSAGARDAAAAALRCLAHAAYEVQLAGLDYALALHGRGEDPDDFLAHLSRLPPGDTLRRIQDDSRYVPTLHAVSKSFYAECAQKALKLLTLIPGCPETQHCIVRLKLDSSEPLTYDRIVAELLGFAQNEPENLRHIYLESVVQLVSQHNHHTEKILPVLRALHGHCAPAAHECARAAVVSFLESNYWRLLDGTEGGNEQDKFEVRATTLALAAILLEDDAPELRARTAAAVSAAHSTSMFGAPKSVRHHSDVICGGAPADSGPPAGRRVLASRAASQLREAAARRAPAALPLLAALDFRAAVRPADPLGDESRVFDQNETHNVYLEEFTWTVDCAEKIKKYHYPRLRNEMTLEDYVTSLVNEHKDTIEKLCIEDAIPCLTERKKSTNPKMDLFWKILHE